ncbi:MAG: hypothetical protein AB7U83_18570 [Vicinamibacterales bacterium]
MTTVMGRVVLAAVLALTGVWTWREAARADATADAWRAVAALDAGITVPAATSGWMRWLPASWRGDDPGPGLQATHDYWQRRFDDLVRTRGGDPDPAVMFTAANAAYRLARRDGGVGAAAAARLDPVLQAYDAVLKAAPGHADAAWNYEFVARARDVLARTRPPARGRAAPDTPGVEDPPQALSVHGVPGAPPPEVKAEDFETIAPMDFGDREAQPEPTPGSRLKRKG